MSQYGEVSGQLYFDVVQRQFVAVTAERGTTLTDERGNLVQSWNHPADAVSSELELPGFIEDEQVHVVEW